MADTELVSSRWVLTGVYVGTGVAAGLLVVVPLARLLQVASEESRGIGGVVGVAAWNTLWTSTAVTVLALIVGAAAAYVTERTTIRGRRWLRVGMVLPLFVPPFASALSWMRTYGPGGLLGRLTGFDLPWLISPLGVVVVITVQAIPLAYVVVASGLAVRVEPDLERAARVSGARLLDTLRFVTFPLLGRTLLGAGALVFISATNSFGIPAILGIPAGFHTITTRIYRDFAFSAAPSAFARAVGLASFLALGAVTIVTIVDRITGIRPITRTATPQGSPTARAGGWTTSGVLWLYLFATSVVPLAGLTLTALIKAVGLTPRPANLTLDNFAEAFTGRFSAAFARSLGLALASATLVVLLAVLVSLLPRSRPGSAMRVASTVTFAIPGSALAVAILLAYGPLLRDTVGLILLAYVSKFWALGHRTVEGSLESIPPDLLRAARSGGAGPLASYRLVTIPLLRPALLAGWVLAFLFGLHELTMSSLLYGPGTDTLAVVVLNLEQLGDVTVTSALAVLLTLPVLVGAMRILGRREPSERLVGIE